MRSGSLVRAVVCVLALGGAVASANSCLAAEVGAAAKIYQFNIKGQSLASALNAFALQSGQQILFTPEVVEGKVTRGVNGALTAEVALERVLAGTGLVASRTKEGMLLVGVGATGQAGVAVGQAEQGGDGPQVAGGLPDLPKDDGLAQIVVTGSHIHGADSKINPVIVIDQAQIQHSGYSSTQDLFRSLPQNFQNSGASEDGFLSGTHAAGLNIDFSSGVDLRGLGPNSTLTLLNGHRLAPSASGSFVDVSQIPLSAIDRVEILTDGSSAIYGSDAVGGVVNIILKKDYQGADTSVRYGATSGGGRDEMLVSQTVGSTWSGGNAVGTLQFQKQGALPVTDRPNSAGTLTIPNDLFPKNHNYGITLDGRQTIIEGLEFYGDVLASKRNSAQYLSSDGIYAPISSNAVSVDVSPGLRYRLTPTWTVELNGLYGYQKSTQNVAETATGFEYIYSLDNRYTESSIDLVVDGRIASTPAGDIALAFGGSYRREDFRASELAFFDGSNAPFPLNSTNRRVTANFAELHVPLVGAKNAIPFVHALELSAAVRQDHYSDFGSTSNPHVGLRWAPIADVSLRASYGKSFRAPNASEVAQEHQQLYLFTDTFSSPTGPGTVPAFDEVGSKSLTPERARTWNFGMEYKPAEFPSFSAAIDYYDIRYADRIVTPFAAADFLQHSGNYGLITPIASDAAAQAVIDAFEAAGGLYINDIGDVNPSGVAGVRYLIDARQQNASLVHQSGVDLTSKFTKTYGAYTWVSQLNVAFIDQINTQYSPGEASINLVNTYANPVKWKARLGSNWGNRGFSISGALNFVGSYVDSNGLDNPPISAWTTIDLVATFNPDTYLPSAGWKGVSVSMVMLNMFDRGPPFVPSLSGGFNPSNYDGTNANPLGRFVALTVRKKW